MKSPFIFNGSFAKNLLPSLNIHDDYYIIQGTVDPTVVAQNAPQGSLYVRTGASPGLYQKQDNGSSTNWTSLSSPIAAGAVHEIPVGVVNGVNANFTLSQTPVNTSSLIMFIDGIEVLPAGYSRLGTVVTFNAGYIPVAGQVVSSYYLVPTVAGVGSIAWTDEIPVGLINGVNVTFTLTTAPTDLNTLNLYQNGIRLNNTVQYTIVGNTITMTVAPAPGQSLWANYRSA